jgi:hypothetical protein
MKVQKILADAWYFYSLNIRYILYLCVPFVFAEALLSEGLIAMATPPDSEQTRGVVGYYAIRLGLYPIYLAILIQFLHARSQGVPIDRSKLFAKTLNVWPMLVLLVVMESVLMVIGFLLFILPGIWIHIRLAFAAFLLVEDDELPVDALRKSFRMTESDFWLILAVWLIPQSVLILLVLTVESFLQGLGNPFVLKLLFHMAAVFLEMFVTVALYRAYMQVRKGQGAP